MKRLILLLTMCFALSLASFTPAAAQVKVNININIDKQPSWGPSGYDYAEFYFIPELNIYYDVANALFYYLSGNSWIGAKYLPVKYKKYDLSSMYKVVMNGVSQPWLDNKKHKKTYKNYINDRTQVPIRQTADSKHESARKNTQPWVDNKPATQTEKKDTKSQPKSGTSSKTSSSSNKKTTTSKTNTSSKQPSSGKTSSSSKSDKKGGKR